MRRPNQSFYNEVIYKNRRGFSLLEVVISIGLLSGIICTGLYFITRIAIKNTQLDEHDELGNIVNIVQIELNDLALDNFKEKSIFYLKLPQSFEEGPVSLSLVFIKNSYKIVIQKNKHFDLKKDADNAIIAEIYSIKNENEVIGFLPFFKSY